MTCDRCKDIHQAQREGKTQRECGCSCHHTFYTGTSTITAATGAMDDIHFTTSGNDTSSTTYTSADTDTETSGITVW